MLLHCLLCGFRCLLGRFVPVHFDLLADKVFADQSKLFLIQDVKALLRLATLYNVPTAINRSSADFLISSPLFEDEEYEPVVKDYKAYVERVLK